MFKSLLVLFAATCAECFLFVPGPDGIYCHSGFGTPGRLYRFYERCWSFQVCSGEVSIDKDGIPYRRDGCQSRSKCIAQEAAGKDSSYTCFKCCDHYLCNVDLCKLPNSTTTPSRPSVTTSH